MNRQMVSGQALLEFMGIAVLSTLLFAWWSNNLMMQFALLSVGTALISGAMVTLTGDFDMVAAMAGGTAGGMLGAAAVMAIRVGAMHHGMQTHHGMMIMGFTMAQMGGVTMAAWFLPGEKRRRAP